MPQLIIKLECDKSACNDVKQFFIRNDLKLVSHVPDPPKYAAISKDLKLNDAKKLLQEMCEISGVNDVRMRRLIVLNSS